MLTIFERATLDQLDAEMARYNPAAHHVHANGAVFIEDVFQGMTRYRPSTDLRQAMDLAFRFGIVCHPLKDRAICHLTGHAAVGYHCVELHQANAASPELALCRAICRCVRAWVPLPV